MSEHKSVEISCPVCNQDALLLRTPVYDGFTKTGDALSCASCGHVFDNEEEVPFKGQEKIEFFTEADRSADPEVFSEEESGRLCRYCKVYVINPFTQWCGRHKKEVEATDTCPQFEKMPEPPPEEEADEAPPKKNPLF